MGDEEGESGDLTQVCCSGKIKHRSREEERASRYVSTLADHLQAATTSLKQRHRQR